MRGEGRHKDKKSKFGKKQTERPEQKRDEESKSGEGSEMIPMEPTSRVIDRQVSRSTGPEGRNDPTV